MSAGARSTLAAGWVTVLLACAASAVAPPPALAQGQADGPIPAQPADERAARIGAVRARIDALRGDVEVLFATAESRHADLRAAVREADPAGNPPWIREDAASSALGRVVVAARGGEARAADVAAGSAALLAEAPPAWRRHVTALLPHLVRRAYDDRAVPPRALSASLFLAAFGPTDFADVWDAWFQEHQLLVRWRGLHNELATLEALPADSAPDGAQPMELEPGDLEPGDPGPGDPRPSDPEPDDPAVDDPGPKDGDADETQPGRQTEPESGPDALGDRTDGPAETLLVTLPRGRFEVGPWEGWTTEISERDNRSTKVSIKVLHVDRHEVTCAQYAAFVSALPEDERSAALPLGWSLDEAGTCAPPEGLADHPVTGVSYLQAVAYATAQNKRLPFEDEWERMASGGDANRIYPWGGSTDGVEFACRESGLETTAPVTQYAADATVEGVLGLAGNVKELVATLPDRKDAKGRIAADAQVVIRGGGYRTRATECTARWRWVVEAGRAEPDVGFRCVMDDAEFRRRR